MPKQTFLTRFDAIIDRLERSPATFEEIANYLQRLYDFGGKDIQQISQRTFQRDIQDIKEQLGIEIKNKRKGDNRYYIVEADEDIQTNRRMIDGFRINNAIASAKNNDKIILLEQRKANGIEHFNQLLLAIQNKKIVKFTHTKYYETESTIRTVHPLALKESLGLWYLLAVDTKDNNLKTFGLDRVTVLDVLKASFKVKYDYDFNKLYKHSFGVIALENKLPQTVQLQFKFEQGLYVKNYPIHYSQTLISSNKSTLTFEYAIYITYDFIMEILKYGSEVKVLQPLSLVKEIKNILSKNLSQYK